MLFSLALYVGGFMSLAGLAAPLLPHADILNILRPFTVCALVILFAWAVAKGRARNALAAGALVAINLPLVLLPLIDDPGYTAPSSRPEVKLISFNVMSQNRQLAKVAAFLQAADADVVLLQELPEKNRPQILPLLRKTYPHVHACACRDQVLLAKRPWLKAGGQPMSLEQPPLIWAQFAGANGQPYRIVGLHIRNPEHPRQQARQYTWLTDKFPATTEPLILAGDFNTTPWSWNLTRFGWASGLQRAATLTTSWPGNLPLQTFLIDNIFTSKGLRVTSFSSGPDLGSDHRPIIARIRLP